MLGGTIASKNRVIQLFFFNSTRISILNNQAIRFANIYFELHTWSCILAKTYSYILDCTVHSVNLSLILILILILSLVVGGKDWPPSPPALEVDHSLLLLPLQPDLVPLGEDPLHAGAEGHQDGDEGAGHGKKAARGTGDLRPKDDTAIDPPKKRNSGQKI